MVSAAASLRGVLPQLLESFAEQQSAAPDIVVNYGASGTLSAQVEAGAAVDLLLLASPKPLERLERSGLLDPDSPVVLAVNQMVLAGAKGSEPSRFHDLMQLPADKLLAIGDPRFVPAGQYARGILAREGAWEQLQRRHQLVLAGDVTRALSWLLRGEVDLAVVYATDLRGHDQLELFDRAASSSEVPRVVGALTERGRAQPMARALLAYLVSDQGGQHFAAAGFEVLR